MTLEDLLRRLVLILERVQVPYMLTGSVASSAHGMPRSTRGIDIGRGLGIAIEPGSSSHLLPA